MIQDLSASQPVGLMQPKAPRAAPSYAPPIGYGGAATQAPAAGFGGPSTLAPAHAQGGHGGYAMQAPVGGYAMQAAPGSYQGAPAQAGYLPTGAQPQNVWLAQPGQQPALQGHGQPWAQQQAAVPKSNANAFLS